MKRVQIRPRPNWQAEVERLGLQFHTPEGHTYWDGIRLLPLHLPRSG